VSTLGKVAHGISDNLITRTAAVALKERRRLVLCVRETPWSAMDFENAHRLSLAGAVVMPVSPPFYGKPVSLRTWWPLFVERVRGAAGLPVTAVGWGAAEPE